MSDITTSKRLVCMPAALSFEGYDLTPHIVMNTYDVTNQPSYEEWIDANFITHRVLTNSSKIQGSFQLKFYKKEDLKEFIDNIGDPKYRYDPVYLEVFVNNILDTKRSFFYIEYTLKNEMPYMDGGKEEEIEGFTVNILEH